MPARSSDFATGRRGAEFGGGDNTLIVDPGAVFVGKADGGLGNNTLELTGGASTGTIGRDRHPVTSISRTVTRSIAGARIGYWPNGNTIASGVTVTDNGTLTNTGTLIGGG